MSTTYDRSFGEMTMDCDGDDGTGMCTESIVLDGEFRECIENAKRAGWSVRPDNFGGWKHYCPGCASKDIAWT